MNGDILKVPVRRLSSSNWWQKTNVNHGWTGDFVYKKIEKTECYHKFNEIIGGFKIKNLPITNKQIKEIEKPRGKEKNRQTVDDINFKIEQCELIGNIIDNKDLLEEN